MKNIILSIIISTTAALTVVSCKKSLNKNNELKTQDSTSVSETKTLPIHDSAASAEPVSAPVQKAETGKTEAQSQSFTIDPIIKDYLALKNALIADNDKGASNAGKQLLNTLKNVDISSVPSGKQKEYKEIADDARENAEHIGDNAGKIDHQREHLAFLSKDVSDLVTLFGSSQKLYQDHCPMFNDGKGAVWISETKAIKNPYYGNQMLSCGSVKKEF
jgi:seryl-tRNA synthetase